MAKEFSYREGKLEEPVLKRNKYPYTPLLFMISFYGMLLRNDCRRVYNYQNSTAPEVVLNRRVQLEKSDPYIRPYTKAIMEGWVDIRYKQLKATQKFDITSNSRRILQFWFNPEILKNRRMVLTLRTIAYQYKEWFNVQANKQSDDKISQFNKYMFLLNPLADEMQLDLFTKGITVKLNNLIDKFTGKTSTTDKTSNKIDPKLMKGVEKYLRTNKNKKTLDLWFELYVAKRINEKGKVVFQRRVIKNYPAFVNALNTISRMPPQSDVQVLPQIVEASVINNAINSTLDITLDDKFDLLASAKVAVHFKSFDEGNKTTLVAYVGDTPAGQVVIKNKGLYSLWVEPAFRKLGVASELLDFAIGDYDIERIKPKPFTTSPFTGQTYESVDKDVLVALYRKFGFEYKNPEDENTDSYMYLPEIDDKNTIEEASPCMGIPYTQKQSMTMPSQIPPSVKI